MCKMKTKSCRYFHNNQWEKSCRYFYRNQWKRLVDNFIIINGKSLVDIFIEIKGKRLVDNFISINGIGVLILKKGRYDLVELTTGIRIEVRMFFVAIKL